MRLLKTSLNDKLLMEQEWIGIQFNLVDDGIIKGRERLKAMGVEITSDHITIKFTKKELKRFDVNKGSEKLRIIRTFLKKYLERSDYTNIYTYLDADKLSKRKSIIQQTDFKQGRIILLENLKDKHSLISNFKTILSQQSVINLIEKNPLLKFMDAILLSLVNRDFALEQKLTLELAYDDKDEWGTDRDNLKVAIQLEIVNDDL